MNELLSTNQVSFNYDGSLSPLESLCFSVTDCPHSTPKWSDSGFLVIRNFNIKKGCLNLSSPSFTDRSTYKDRISRAKPEPGDIIITREAPMGQVCMIPEGIECCLGQRMVLLKVNRNKVTSEYLLFALQSEFVQKQIQKSDKTGSIVSNLCIPDLKAIKIPVLKNQESIGFMLNNINKKIELNNRINAELEAMAKTLYDYWFVQFDFPDANGKPYKTSGGRMVYHPTLKREIPEGWSAVSLFDAMDVQYGFPFDTSKFTENLTGNAVARIRDVIENTISCYTTEDVDRKFLLKANDLLVAMDGNFHINFWSKSGVYLNQRTVRIRDKSNSLISIFQSYFELSPYIKAREKNVSRTTVGHLSDKDLKGLYLLSPNPSESFNPKILFDPLLDKMMLNRLQNETLSSLRDWLLPMIMNGQVTVNS
jgi:type I restriction enzyme S subunit